MLETSIRFLARRAGNRASALVAPAVFTTRRVGSTLVAASSSSFGAETDITTLDLLFHKIDMIECHVAGLNFHDGRRLFEQMINIESEVADLQRSMADACTQLALMTTTSYGDADEIGHHDDNDDSLKTKRLIEETTARLMDAHTVVKSTRERVRLVSLIDDDDPTIVRATRTRPAC